MSRIDADNPECSWFHRKPLVPRLEECMARSDGPCPTRCHGIPVNCTQRGARSAQLMTRSANERPVSLLVRLARRGE